MAKIMNAKRPNVAIVIKENAGTSPAFLL